ncbi:MAG: hypothetical protein K2H01_02075 [Ruminococcus sp.]|nr:hypothetical protein [Ruminococcus sp.]
MDKNFEIKPVEEIKDVERRPEYKKLNFTSAQKMHLSALYQQLPTVMAADALNNAYILKMPEGLSTACHPMVYKTGGIGNIIQDTNCKIVGHGSLHDLSAQATILGMFSIMSIASGQYFLTKINSELTKINQKIDKILEFLYGNKKAELMAEVSFVKYAYQNYSSIMNHEYQRTATIASLQNAKKVAMKDIEFYIGDLDYTISSKSESNIDKLVDKAFSIKESLEFSMQLYGMSSLLEVYYSQNFDSQYLKYVENDISTYMDKCEKRMLNNFSALKVLAQNANGFLFMKVDTSSIEKKIDGFIESLTQGEESEIRKSLKKSLNAVTRESEYYITMNGDVYLKK